MGKVWKCPQDGAVLLDASATGAGFELKRDGRWHITFACRGPDGSRAPHEVVVTKRGIGAVAACPKKSYKPDRGLQPAPPPAREPRRTIIVRRV